jgi:hypothetical protein
MILVRELYKHSSFFLLLNTSRNASARINAMSDEDIDISDIPPLSEEFFH